MTGLGHVVGCIADDITGATDLASALAGRGLHVRLAFGADAVRGPAVDAVVVALKIRSVRPSEARAEATRAARALRDAGARQLFSKYCSTFDSTAEGNIGPIADALADFSGARRIVHSPAYPANQRTVYLGHLFVGDQLLSESPMRHHPLNPMHDSHLIRVLGEQTSRGVAPLRLPTVEAGEIAISARLAEIADRSVVGHHVIADGVREADLDAVAHAVAEDRLAAGSAAFGAAFAAAARARATTAEPATRHWPVPPPGPTAILAGSLSRATRNQVQSFDGPKLALSLEDLLDGDRAVEHAITFATQALSQGPLLISTAENVRPADHLNQGADADTSRRVEDTMGRIGSELVHLGVRRLIVAGGETSGAVADALALRSAKIGPDIAVGVPWIVAEDRGLAIAFKSGNFGGPTFFRDALRVAGR